MTDRPSGSADIPEFPGFVSNRDPADAPQAPVAGQNMRMHRPGLLVPRKGFKPLAFGNAISDTSDAIIAGFGYHRPDAEFFVYEDSAGAVRTGRNPA